MMIETWLAMDIWTILTFTGIGIMLNLTPGADVIFAMACGMQGGWQNGVAAAAGITLGTVWHLMLAMSGLSAAIMLMPHAFDIIKIAGAGYLLWLAWQAWTAPPPAETDANMSAIDGTASGITHPQMPKTEAPKLNAAIARGFVTNALNPKVALFILALLPQFTDPNLGPIWPQIVLLGAIFMTTGFIITGIYGASAGLLGTQLRNSGRLMSRLTAVVFIGLAARLVLAEGE